ncbi:MAG: DUF4406 domain-containing protein [Candidatus Saccharimonadales bacterium]
MKLYLGGKMVGVPGMGFEDFDVVAEVLRIAGHEVFNPAEHDRSMGFDPDSDYIGSYKDVADSGFNRRAALLADLTWIMTESEGMVVFENWRDSPGTRAEIAAHQSIFLPVWERDDFLLMGTYAPTLNSLVDGGKVLA